MIKTYPYYDLVSYKFSYDSEIKEIAVYFDGYFDENEYIEKKWGNYTNLLTVYLS